MLHAGVKTDVGAVAVGGCSGHRRLDKYRTAEFLCSVGDVNGMQVLGESAVYLRFCHQVDRPSRGVDDGSAGDADLRKQVGAAQIGVAIYRSASGRNQAYAPVDGSMVGINCVQAIVLGGHVKNVMACTGDA